MPVYRYLCQECGQITRILRRMTENKAPARCIKCGSGELIRVFSPVGMSVKGASSLEGSPCCGRDTPCNVPPCSESGTCQR